MPESIFVWTLGDVFGIACLVVLVVGFALFALWNWTKEKWWEMRNPELCPLCKGQGWRNVGTGRCSCIKCNKTGKRNV
jgi:hypothetical protein